MYQASSTLGCGPDVDHVMYIIGTNLALNKYCNTSDHHIAVSSVILIFYTPSIIASVADSSLQPITCVYLNYLGEGSTSSKRKCCYSHPWLEAQESKIGRALREAVIVCSLYLSLRSIISNTSQSWASMSSCMQRWVDSAFL